MAKNRYGKMQGNMQYNRPSGGYQKNLYKQQINTQGIKQPKAVSQKQVRNFAIGAGVVWLLASVLLVYKLKWIGLIIALLIGLMAVGAGYLWLQRKEREMLTYYKKIGMTEEMYIKELRKRNVDKKQIDQVRKNWKKLDVDPVIAAPNKKKK